MSDPSDWPLLHLSASSDLALREAYRAVYLSEYVRADVRNWNGERVRFNAPTFNHAFSEASSYKTSLGVHDVPFSIVRAERIRWIKLALAGSGADIDVIAQMRTDNRGRAQRRRTLIVVQKCYVVVLELQQSPPDFSYDFITAFPADDDYLRKIRAAGPTTERRRQK